MITNAKDFYASIQGKRVAFCGIGGSNHPAAARGRPTSAVSSSGERKFCQNGRHPVRSVRQNNAW